MTMARANPPRGFTLSDRAAFWVIAVIFGIFTFAAAAPSPLYRVYEGLWGFSPLTLTVVFAVYAAGLLLALLITGRLSDHLGRRPVILGAIAAEIAAMALFIAADSTLVLGAARAMQGLATGVLLGAASAALTEFCNPRNPTLGTVVTSTAPPIGLAAGGLGASALVQFGPAPLRLVYWLIVAGLVAGAAALAAMRETSEQHSGALASLRPTVSVPPEARTAFATIIPSLVALWALNGFYLSLAPGLVESIAGSHNLLWGGATVFCFCLSGGIAVLLLHEATSQTAMLAGCVILCAGAGLVVLAIYAGSTALFLIGTVVAGIGFGLGFLGNVRAVVDVASHEQRAGILAVLYTVSYAMFSVPIVVAGVAETHFSAHDVAIVFSCCITALAAIGIASSLNHRRLTGRDGALAAG